MLYKYNTNQIQKLSIYEIIFKFLLCAYMLNNKQLHEKHITIF